MEAERVQKVEKENEKLMKMIAGGAREKVKEIKEILSKSRKCSPEKTMMIHNMTTMMSPNQSMISVTKNVTMLTENPKRFSGRPEWK